MCGRVGRDPRVPMSFSMVKLPELGESGAPALLSSNEAKRPIAGNAGGDQAALDKSVLDADNSFSRLCDAKGEKEAFGKVACRDLIVIREKVGILTGLDAVSTASPKLPQITGSQPIEAHASRSGDLGYSYGSCLSKWPEKDAVGRHYIRVSRKASGDGWMILLDIVNVRPETSTPQAQKPPEK